MHFPVSRRMRACVFACAFFASHAAFAQNSAVSFTASENAVTDPQSIIGINGAVAGFFHHNRKLDFLYGGTDRSRGFPTTYNNLATNNGNGTFTATAANDCDLVPDFSTDLDGDGVWDIWCSNFSTVQYGDGQGGFSAQYTYAADPNPAVLDAVAADFNGDGRTDIAVITQSHKLAILLNEGSRVFTLVHSYPIPAFTGALPPLKLLAEDLNGDHKYDLVIVYGGTANNVTPYLATTGGAFTQGATTSIGATLFTPVNVAGRDVNRDGHGDIAVLTTTGVKFMLGTPAGNFVAGPAISSSGAGCSGLTQGGECLVLTDLNEDGNVDMALAGGFVISPGTSQDFVRVYLGDGTGHFGNPTEYSIPVVPKVLIAGDVNNTGRMDLIVAHDSQATFSVLRNVGSGRFFSAPTTISAHAQGMVSADFNRDGKADLAVVNSPTCAAPCGGTVSIFPGSGGAFFNPVAKYSIGMHGYAIAVGDLNNDGFKDLVITNATAGDNADVSVLLGTASGGFQAARNFTLGSLSKDAYLVDLNKDGKLDLVEDGGVALGKGDGSFGPLTAFPAGLVYSSSGSDLFAMGDFNGDGNIDVAFVPPNGEDGTAFIQILLGDGRGGFTVGQNLIAAFEPIQSIAAGTVRPGKPVDLVVSYNGIFGISNGSQVNTGVVTVVGNGNGTFTPGAGVIQGINYTHQYAGPLAIGDFNGDGKPDIGVTDSTTGQFAVIPGNGNDTFGSPAVFAATNNGVGIAIADFDGNGLPDVMLSSNDGVTRLYANRVPTISPGALAFTGSANSQATITVKNTLASTVTIGSAINQEPSPFSVQATTCGSSLAPAQTCTITVAVQTGTGLQSSGDLFITSNGAQVDDVLLTYFP